MVALNWVKWSLICANDPNPKLLLSDNWAANDPKRRRHNQFREHLSNDQLQMFIIQMAMSKRSRSKCPSASRNTTNHRLRAGCTETEVEQSWDQEVASSWWRPKLLLVGKNSHKTEKHTIWRHNCTDHLDIHLRWTEGGHTWLHPSVILHVLHTLCNCTPHWTLKTTH